MMESAEDRHYLELPDHQEWGKRRRPEHESPRGDSCEDFGARGSRVDEALTDDTRRDSS
jgi:hypothetical protein